MSETPNTKALQNIRLFGFLMLAALVVYLVWVNHTTQSGVTEAIEMLTQLEQEAEGSGLHLHDTYYIVGDPPVIIPSIIALTISGISILFPQIFCSKKK